MAGVAAAGVAGLAVAGVAGFAAVWCVTLALDFAVSDGCAFDTPWAASSAGTASVAATNMSLRSMFVSSLRVL